MDGRHVGRVIRSIREHLGKTQSEVAGEAGVSQGAVSRSERGLVGELPVDAVARIVSALGASLYLDIRYQGGAGDRLLDRVHAALVDHVVATLHAHWDVIVEYTFNEFGERGSVDVLAWHARTRTLLVVEVKSALTDLQAMLLSLGRKLRLMPDIVRRERGWDPVAVGRIVVVAGTTSNRRVVTAHPAVFDVSLPARAREIKAWLREPSGPIAGVWFVSREAVPSVRATGQRRRRMRADRVSDLATTAPDHAPTPPDHAPIPPDRAPTAPDRAPTAPDRAPTGPPPRPDQAPISPDLAPTPPNVPPSVPTNLLDDQSARSPDSRPS